MKKGRTKGVKLEMAMLLPEGVNLNSATLLAKFMEVLEGLPDGDQIKIERLKYEPGYVLGK
jgi:hypothetical protein